MKKTMYFVAIATMFMLSSCGALKKSPQQTYYPQYAPQQTQQTTAAPTPQERNAGRKEVTLNAAQLAEQENYFTRAWATGTSFSQGQAGQNANFNARQELAAHVETVVEAALQRYYQQDMNANHSAVKIEEVEQMKNIGTQIIVQNISYKTIEKVMYEMGDASYECHVCLELSMPEDEFVNKSAAVVEEISRDSKMQTEFDSKRFKEEMKAQIEEYKNSK